MVVVVYVVYVVLLRLLLLRESKEGKEIKNFTLLALPSSFSLLPFSVAKSNFIILPPLSPPPPLKKF